MKAREAVALEAIRLVLPISFLNHKLIRSAAGEPPVLRHIHDISIS